MARTLKKYIFCGFQKSMHSSLQNNFTRKLFAKFWVYIRPIYICIIGKLRNEGLTLELFRILTSIYSQSPWPRVYKIAKKKHAIWLLKMWLFLHKKSIKIFKVVEGKFQTSNTGNCQNNCYEITLMKIKRTWILDCRWSVAITDDFRGVEACSERCNNRINNV